MTMCWFSTISRDDLDVYSAIDRYIIHLFLLISCFQRKVVKYSTVISRIERPIMAIRHMLTFKSFCRGECRSRNRTKRKSIPYRHAKEAITPPAIMPASRRLIMTILGRHFQVPSPLTFLFSLIPLTLDIHNSL